MSAAKSFPVLGEHVDMLITSEMTGGLSRNPAVLDSAAAVAD